MIYLHKILPAFFLPLGIALVLLLAGLVSGRRWVSRTGLAILCLSSTPIIGSFLIRATERWAERLPAIDAPTADAIVVLSAGRVVAPGVAGISEWGDPDRFFSGVELFHAKKAPLLVFTGGFAPWQAEARLEGDVLKKSAVAAGIPTERILTTGPVTTTSEEARAVADILRQHYTSPRVLLVTSAFHMPRAQYLFQAAGLSVSPFPVDFQHSSSQNLTILDFIPNPSALTQTHIALRETYGTLFSYVISF